MKPLFGAELTEEVPKGQDVNDYMLAKVRAPHAPRAAATLAGALFSPTASLASSLCRARSLWRA